MQSQSDKNKGGEAVGYDGKNASGAGARNRSDTLSSAATHLGENEAILFYSCR